MLNWQFHCSGCDDAWGLVVLLPALRIKGSYFALVTLAFMELMYQLVQVIRPDLTGGTRGMSGIQTLTRGAVSGFYLSSVLMVIVAIAAWLLMRTRLGTALTAVGLNESAVEGSGLSTTKLKMVAFLVSAFVAGLEGHLCALPRIHRAASFVRYQFCVHDYRCGFDWGGFNNYRPHHWGVFSHVFA